MEYNVIPESILRTGQISYGQWTMEYNVIPESILKIGQISYKINGMKTTTGI
jgi:hypothetical protein